MYSNTALSVTMLLMTFTAEVNVVQLTHIILSGVPLLEVKCLKDLRKEEHDKLGTISRCTLAQRESYSISFLNFCMYISTPNFAKFLEVENYNVFSCIIQINSYVVSNFDSYNLYSRLDEPISMN